MNITKEHIGKKMRVKNWNWKANTFILIEWVRGDRYAGVFDDGTAITGTCVDNKEWEIIEDPEDRAPVKTPSARILEIKAGMLGRRVIKIPRPQQTASEKFLLWRAAKPSASRKARRLQIHLDAVLVAAVVGGAVLAAVVVMKW